VFIYFISQQLGVGVHKIDIAVTAANETNQFIFDYIWIYLAPDELSSTVSTSSSTPPPTSSNTPSSTSTSSGLPTTGPHVPLPVGAIAGGVVGGIFGIAILAIALWYFLRKRPGGCWTYSFDKPSRTIRPRQ
jgi:hypothetical protein